MSTAKRSPPFRAEHVGSLLRPDELVQKRYAVAAGKADAEELKPIEDKSVTEVVKLQKDCGFHAVSSGEYTRYAFLFSCEALLSCEIRSASKSILISSQSMSISLQSITISSHLITINVPLHNNSAFIYTQNITQQHPRSNITQTPQEQPKASTNLF
jgi:hypothetical protein